MNIANKTTWMLNFIKCHLIKCSSDIKASAYLLMVRTSNGVAMCASSGTLTTDTSITLKKGSKAQSYLTIAYCYVTTAQLVTISKAKEAAETQFVVSNNAWSNRPPCLYCI